MGKKKKESKESLKPFKNVTLSGSQVDDAFEFDNKFRRLQKKVSPKGNIFEPVMTVDYPGFPLSFPINIFKIPHRKANFALSTLKPGYGYPPEIHDNVDDVYFIVKGSGKVDIGGVSYDAKQYDVFHIVAGTWHRLYNPEENNEDLLVWLVETPGAPFHMKIQEWDLAKKFEKKLEL